jgi:glycosyltransferase involved in cell wall biosynthesis
MTIDTEVGRLCTLLAKGEISMRSASHIEAHKLSHHADHAARAAALRPVRVLQVCKFYHPVMGGMETVAWELTEGLTRKGFIVKVLAAHQQLLGSSERTLYGAELRRAGSVGTVLSTSITPSMPLHLMGMAANCDIVHIHMPDPMSAAALWLARPRSKVVVHWHSDVIRQRRAMRLYQPLQDWLLNRADAIISTSQPYADSSHHLQPFRHKVHIVPIGITDVSKEVVPGRVEEFRQLANARHVVLALGRMSYYKGFDLLIEAAKSIPEDCAVLIAGEGELLDDLRGLARNRGVSGRVKLIGHVSDGDLPSLFAACDVFTMPSTVRAEAYGIAMLEAMMMGKPIVAADIPGSGVPWVSRHNETGLNVPAGDAEALAAAITSLIQDPTRRLRLGTKARERFVDGFQAEQMTNLVRQIYCEMLGINSI